MMTSTESREANTDGPEGRPPEVPFPLLATIGLDVVPRGGRARELVLATIFATAHLSFLLALRGAPSTADTAALANFETATYLDIPPPTAVESPRRVAKPRPVGVSSAVTVPAVQSDVVRPDKAAGFQELLVPKDVEALPPPDPGGTAVDDKDFSGRGVVGGVAGGKPPPVVAADIAAQMAREGTLSDIVEAASDTFQKAVSIEVVAVRPELLNRNEVLALLLRHYPAALRQAGMEGSALVQFVVDTSGRVDPQSVTVISSTNALFATAAIEVAKKARFSPGRNADEGVMQAVPVRVQAPLTWTLSK